MPPRRRFREMVSPRALPREKVAAALRAGAWAVVVGRAITMPEAITKRFAAALREAARLSG